MRVNGFDGQLSWGVISCILIDDCVNLGVYERCVYVRVLAICMAWAIILWRVRTNWLKAIRVRVDAIERDTTTTLFEKKITKKKDKFYEGVIESNQTVSDIEVV